MSLDATKWAWGKSLKPAGKLILLSMADRAGETHEAFPSVERLKLDTGLNRKTVLKWLQDLQDSDIILDTGKRVGRTNQVKVYRLLGVVGREETVPKVEQSQKGDSSKKGTGNSAKSGTAKESQNRDTESTSIKPPIESTKNKDVFSKLDFKPDVKKACEDYQKHIKPLGVSYKKTEIAWKLFVNQVLKFISDYGAEETISCIYSAINGNWKKLYPPKNYSAKPKNEGGAWHQNY